MDDSYEIHVPDSSPRVPNVIAVLMHGGASSSRMYRTLQPILTIPSVALDLPGHGRSVSLGPFTFENSTRQLHTYLDSLQKNAEYHDYKVVLVGISLGGQAVLDYLMNHPSTVHGAIVSGASINPPNTSATWEMPHLPTDQEWLDIFAQDVEIMGMENATALQEQSLGFTFAPTVNEERRYPPVLICVGEHDVAMAKRDFNELVERVKRTNANSDGIVLESAWHNHSVDVPEKFAALIEQWIEKLSNAA